MTWNEAVAQAAKALADGRADLALEYRLLAGEIRVGRSESS